jgi:hypothetical protein
VRQRRHTAEPKFIWGTPLVGSGGCQAGEVHSGRTEFIPEVPGGVTCNLHGVSLPEECSVETFCPPVLCRGIGGHKLVIDSQRFAPVLHRLRDQFTIVSYEDPERVTSLDSDSLVPGLEILCLVKSTQYFSLSELCLLVASKKST